MNTQSFINGFVKRANAHGINTPTALEMLKQAAGMPTAGSMSPSMPPPQAGGGFATTMPGFQAQPMLSGTRAPIAPASALSASAPAPMPAPQQAPDWGRAFQKAHGSAFDPHSAMDKWKMQQLQSGNSGVGNQDFRTARAQGGLNRIG